MSPPTSSFTASRVNPSTFLIVERDLYGEHPFIYVKIHPDKPVIVLSDTGCDEPAEDVKHAAITHLREFIETCPLAANADQPLNPNGSRTYVIIVTHCHYDHIGGIAQFLAGGTTQIIASAAGRDFIESDLGAHSLCNHERIPVPYFHFTHWAQAFERLTWPLSSSMPGDEPPENLRPPDSTRRPPEPADLGITIIHTPGHTPDELAWYDHAERLLFVGDSFYEQGPDLMPIIFPPQGSLIEWFYSVRKLRDFVLSQDSLTYDGDLEEHDDNDDDDDDDHDDNGEGWLRVPSAIKIAAAHQTSAADAHALIAQLAIFASGVLDGAIPVARSGRQFGETYDLWRSAGEGKGGERALSLWCPSRLVEDARAFFGSAAHPLAFLSPGSDCCG